MTTFVAAVVSEFPGCRSRSAGGLECIVTQCTWWSVRGQECSLFGCTYPSVRGLECTFLGAVVGTSAPKEEHRCPALNQIVVYLGRETNGGSPSALRHFPADIWRFGRLAFGLLAPGTFPGQDIFGSWTLGAGTSGAWKFGAPDKWQPRLLVAGTIHAADVWRPDIWCPGPLAFETFLVWVKPRPDI